MLSAEAKNLTSAKHLTNTGMAQWPFLSSRTCPRAGTSARRGAEAAEARTGRSRASKKRSKTERRLGTRGPEEGRCGVVDVPRSV